VGREALEDIELGWRLKNEGYDFVIDPELELAHNEGTRLDDAITLGKKGGRNRVRIFRRHGDAINLPLFIWAGLGEVIKYSLFPLLGGSREYHHSRAKGIIIRVYWPDLQRIF